MIKQIRTILSTCVVALFLLTRTLRAAVLLSGPGDGATSTSSPSVVFGYDFTVGPSSLVVTTLGLWDDSLDGFNSAHDVSVWTTGGTLLGSVIVPSGSLAPLVGEFRYAPLDVPLTLIAGESYVFGAYYPTQTDFFKVNSPGQAEAIFSSFATFGGSRSREGSGFPFPGGSDLVAGPNMEFTPVPEPSSVVLGLIAAIAFFLTPLKKQTG